MTHLTISEYRKMVTDIIKFKKEHGCMPEVANIQNRRIPHEHYSIMINNVNNYILLHGRSPEYVQIQ